MNLLCPNCQKMLTVPDEFAGQTMKCPLCSGDFTVPGLPGASLPSPSPVGPETDLYSIRHEPSPPPPPVSYLPPPPPEPAAPLTAPQKPSPLREDYRRILSGSLNPQILPWIAPVCLVLVFFLQFFDWDGLNAGREPAETANAWGAAFGFYAVDGDLKTLVPFTDDEKFKPGVSILTIFYLLLFFPALAVTIASVVIPLLSIKLPPYVNDLMPWRWGIVLAANLLVFLFLGLQLIFGFSLDSRYSDWVKNETNREAKSNPTTQEKKMADAARGEALERLHYTRWLRFVVLLHLTAIVSSALMVWIDRRGPLCPLPRWELRW